MYGREQSTRKEGVYSLTVENCLCMVMVKSRATFAGFYYSFEAPCREYCLLVCPWGSPVPMTFPHLCSPLLLYLIPALELQGGVET